MGVLKLEKVATIDSNTPQYPKHKAIELWENGIWGATAYVWYIIQYEMNKTPGWVMDIDKVMFDWRGVVDEKGKQKSLSRKQLMSAVLDLEEKGYLDRHPLKVQLSLL